MIENGTRCVQRGNVGSDQTAGRFPWPTTYIIQDPSLRLFPFPSHHLCPRVRPLPLPVMSHTPRTPMGPPQDVVMGPPPLPPQAGQPATQKPPKEPDITAKYSRLKRKYFELEEVSRRVPSCSRAAYSTHSSHRRDLQHGHSNVLQTCV